jgi:ParB family transcriptional regulator, chromosome partitioning protein
MDGCKPSPGCVLGRRHGSAIFGDLRPCHARLSLVHDHDPGAFMTAKRGMGRGLAAILPESSAGGPELRELDVGQIQPNPDQPRVKFDTAALEALAGSIGAVGLLQPLIVRPLEDGRYELVAGERRWRAAQKAGIERVPAVIRTSPEDERLQAALIENMVREDLNPVEEARACAALVDDLGISKEELARRVGRSRAAISNLIRLLDLPDPVLGLLERGDLTEGHGRAILQVRDQDRRTKLAERAAAEEWSVRDTERHASGGGRRKTKTTGGRISAEERAAMSEAEDLLGSALGQDVRVRRAGDGVKAELRFDELSELESLARRLRKRG